MKVAIVLVSSLLVAVVSAIEPTLVLQRQLTLGPADIMIKFASTQPTLNALNVARFASKNEKRTSLRVNLLEFANQSQKNVLAFLEKKGIETEQFWISNELYIKDADAALVAELSQFKEIEEIRENEIIELEKPVHSVSFRNNIFAEWGVENTRANLVWTMSGGTTGSGITVATIDTGALLNHEILRSNFYGTYGWYDPYSYTTSPNDQNGHGTHTVGTIAGSNGYGVAPGVQWQACKGCSGSSCTNAALTACGQWVACPTLPNGSSANCNHAPDVCSNSWGGGRGQNWYDSVISAWHSAGIIPVFANGNSGPSCNTANSPADSRSGAIAVGSITSGNAMSSFSSKGPSAFSTIKPDISAPGTSVRSSYYTSTTAYATLSGTSMACPHVSGVVALLLSLNQNLSYSSLYSILSRTASTSVSSTGYNCGSINDGSVFPNNAYGYGKIDAYSAAQAVLRMNNSS
jgi:subtilisin family serine protease